MSLNYVARPNSPFRTHAGLACLLSTLSACGSGLDAQSNAAPFPTDLAISSPTTVAESGRATRSSALHSPVMSAEHSPKLITLEAQDYSTLTSQLATMIAAASPSDCAFDFDVNPHFVDAGCYGPLIDYAHHPDGSDSSPSVLPTGDVGIWDATDDTTGIACAAAQLNSRVNGIGRLANGGVFLGASLYCSAKADSTIGLPADGETKDVTSAMASNLSSDGISLSISLAKITRDGDTYTYTIEGETADGEPVALRMKHRDGTGNDYVGKISFSIEQFDGELQNCDIAHPGATGNVTHAVSIAYELNDGVISYETNAATFCGAGANPYASDTQLTVDASKKFNSSTAPNGWANNFSRARASFDRDTYAGDYGFTWQAGMNDGNTRTLLMSIREFAATNAGVAYFGFGPDMEDADGAEINGMICNWAGPGYSHTLQPYVQKQTFAGSIEDFAAIDSEITYAPANNCTADDGFVYTSATGTQASPVDVSPDMTNDHAASGIVSNGLTAYSASDMPSPTSPTDIDTE